MNRIKPLLLCILLALSLPAHAAEPAFALQIPAPETIAAAIKKEHPRLLLSKDASERLREIVRNNPLARAWYAELQRDAREILSANPSRYEIPDGLRLLATSRRVMNRIYTLGLVYRLDGDRRYADRAWRELEAAARFPDWNPRHFLDTAEMTHAFAIGYDWFYGAWNDEQRAALVQAMLDKGLTPALDIYAGKNRNGWWSKARHNWNQVCNGGLGMGALAIGSEHPELAGKILHDALESLPLAMAEFAPDGAWVEGPGYWNYATSYNCYFLAALESALGTDYGLSKIPGFSETGWFPMFMTGPLGRTFNYADGSDGTIRAPQMFWLARRFDQPAFAWYERQVARPSALDLVWLDTRGEGPQQIGIPLVKYFRGAELATFRSAWGDKEALFVGFKAGDNKVNHSHLDLGTFVLDALGQRWALDLGADNYNLPGYFGGQRWNYYRLRAEGHNTLVINSASAPDQNPKAATRIIKFENKPDHAFAVADLTPAYRVRKVQRGVAFQQGERVVVQDEVQADQPSEVWWFMHTPAEVTLDDSGTLAILRQGGKELRARLSSPAKARFEIKAAEPLPSSPHPERQANNDKVRKLAVHLTGITDARIVVTLAPGGAVARGRTEGTKPLAEW